MQILAWLLVFHARGQYVILLIFSWMKKKWFHPAKKAIVSGVFRGIEWMEKGHFLFAFRNHKAGISESFSRLWGL